MRRQSDEPAIIQLRPDVLEVCVAHVVHAEDVDVRVLGNACLDVGVELEGELFALFCGAGEVDDFCAFGFWHFGVWVNVV